MTKNKLSHVLSGLFLAILVSCSTTARHPDGQIAVTQTQITGWNFDWDDNIMYMPTPIILYEKGKTAEDIQHKNGISVAVSTEEFTEVKNIVGPAESRVPLEEIPEKFKKYLGFSALGDSYYFFRDHKANSFKNDIVRALKGDRPPGVKKSAPFTWKGPSFEAFQTALSDVESAKWTSIITARGHSRDYMMEGLKVLQNKKYLKLLPSKENVYAVTNPEVSNATPGNPSEIKAKIMIQFLDKMAATPVNENMVPVLNQDGNAKTPLHLWGFSDDDYDNYTKAKEVLSAAIKENPHRWQNIKITLFYTGKMKPHIPAFRVVIKSDGELRPYGQAEAEEVATILKTRKELASVAK